MWTSGSDHERCKTDFAAVCVNKNVMVLKGFFLEIVFPDLDSGDFQFFSFYTPSGEILGLPLLNQSTIDS